MDIECTGRRISNMKTLKYEIGAWTKRRNGHKKKIEWKSTKKNTDEKNVNVLCQIIKWLRQ